MTVGQSLSQEEVSETERVWKDRAEKALQILGEVESGTVEVVHPQRGKKIAFIDDAREALEKIARGMGEMHFTLGGQLLLSRDEEDRSLTLGDWKEELLSGGEKIGFSITDRGADRKNERVEFEVGYFPGEKRYTCRFHDDRRHAGLPLTEEQLEQLSRLDPGAFKSWVVRTSE
jgi:hypothetical protein